jgi:hypothetical protein
MINEIESSVMADNQQSGRTQEVQSRGGDSMYSVGENKVAFVYLDRRKLCRNDNKTVAGRSKYIKAQTMKNNKERTDNVTTADVVCAQEQ